MAETSLVLRAATPHSLVLLDEVGRGTSTYDGLSIAWAVVEHLHDVTRARTLFATHFHELTALADTLPRLHNIHVVAKEWGEDIVFLRTVEDGAAAQSFGIQVAKLAGLPASVLQRARDVMATLDGSGGSKRIIADAAPQLSLFSAATPTPPDRPVNPEIQAILASIKSTQVMAMTPLQALNALAALVERAQSIE
jgi:DNA mismatch repair protein MutS